MIETGSSVDTSDADFARDQGLVYEIPAGIADLLHERARERYLRRLWQTLFCGILVLFLVSTAPGFGLTPGERIAGVAAAIGFLGYLVYGFTLVWPERWEHQLLEEEIDYRRQNGKWRWDR
jgi:lipopolysaccharide export LptBFGC system permease protein LptF